ncbi:MAG TPA: SGNH/GDSL hydrolase family protein [Thermomicrobiales bacterium]|nr:SGNH/GDSL hydrolase family protein [Thermomicrobiales bacterium]
MHAPPRQSIVLLFLAALALAGGGFWWAGQRQGAAATPGVYVALGASDAVGVGADRPERDGWVPLVQAGLPPGTQLVNLGVSGATLGDVLAAQLPVALDARPRWVTLWPGVNDLRDGVALDTFAGQLDTLLGRLAGAPGATVVVLNIPDLRVLPAFAGVDHAQLDATVHQWNAVIADAARRHGALLVDLYAGWRELAAHPEYVSADGFHPSSAGYRRIADFALAALKAHERASSGAWRRV